MLTALFAYIVISFPNGLLYAAMFAGKYVRCLQRVFACFYEFWANFVHVSRVYLLSLKIRIAVRDIVTFEY